MASCTEPSVRSSCSSLSFTGDEKRVRGEKIQEQSSTEKPNINRLKRAKRTKKSDVVLSECKVMRPEVTGDDEKRSHASTMKKTRPLTPHSTQCSPPKQGLLLHLMETSLGQNKLEVKSELGASSLHQTSILADEAQGPSGSRAERREHEESENDTVLNACSKSTPASLSHQFQTSAEFFKELTAHTQEEVLKQIHDQNPHFPVRHVFQTLLKRLGDRKSGSVIPVAGKRKQEVESHSDGRLRKRQHTSQDESEIRNGSDGRVNSRYGAISRNRLRRKQPRVQNTALDEGHATHDDDMPWTEKYRPRSADEVVGNSAAVKKLYSWLKEWRIRADVEERRKRREERQMKEESDGSWDRGDFKGDPLMECEGELCNTLLIHGPTGAGKSAAVFACAEQLGFKVLEVNSSSLRSGRLVLSQLRESTQSHQVGAPQCSASLTRTPAAASREAAPQKSVSSCRKPSAIPRAASRKKRVTAQKSVTLTHYFRKSGKLVSSELQETRAAADVTVDESEFNKDGALDKKDKTAAISLILFEEVDIVFQEDVGFLRAVKSLMSTTKRPIILTANDPSFGKSFDGHFEEIRFRTPAVETIVSYLQCVCVVERVKPDPEHIRFMLQENNGDVRRSLLELELWARSGAGSTHHHLHNRALTCRSYAELESSRCAEVLVDSWRKGRSLLYSNLDLLLAPPTVEKVDQSTFDQITICTTFQKEAIKSPPSSRNRSRLQVKRHLLKIKHSESALPLDRFKRMNQSAAEAGGFSKVDSLAHLFDTMSFMDSYLSQQPCCKSGPLGVKMADGLLDEPREEADVEMRTRSLERCYEILAVVEGLGFHRCRMEACPMKQGNQDMMGGDKNKTRKLSAQKRGEVVHKVLCSKAFRCHGNRTAILTDYLPCVRFICREQDAERQPELRFSHYLRDIGLRLPKSILNLLASPLH
ncbi:ATPase family AAA domain-containing protein 5b isoform X2 [Neoarius graeffei]|uniref:ATPase family AAA domain-containing protein 5b isoform X2 n=1 Tax=Neoarius graeffei TaxID=443677 RepID=UPI00298C56FF|nr:ATPase family AAA domain-containing protein 5b isoform X2 [Neoarius graeffei]